MKKQESPGFSREEQVNYMRVYIDIETYGEVPLKKSNVYRYAEDPTFEILMMAYAVDDSPVEVVEGHGACVAKFRELRAEADVLVAHNAQFERVCFSYACRDLFLPPAEWDDPMVRAYAYGYPGSLGLLTKALKVSYKDDDGKRLIRKFSCPCPANQKRRRWFAEDAPEDWAKFVDYCRQDVEALRAVDRELAALPAFERELWELDQAICDRGVRLDVAMAEKAVELNDSITADLSQQVTDLLGIENPKSVQQFTAALSEEGVVMQSLDKKAVAKALLRDDLPEKARKALELRQELALSAVAKYQAELRIVNKDSRMRGLVRYFGAHTGRWAGTGPQLHNLPNNTPPPGRLAAGHFDLMYLGKSSPEMLKAMIRSSILGPVTVVDFSAIEGRVIAWLAGEQWVLDAYRGGRDVYVETARQMKFFTPDGEPDRKAGKVAVLACLAKGTLVTTHLGEIPIEEVTTEHLLWDGSSWVKHEGVIYKGEKHVIEYQGLQATEDHLVWVEEEEGPIPFGLASKRRLNLKKSGPGRQEVRRVRSVLTRTEVPGPQASESVRSGGVRSLWSTGVEEPLQLGEWTYEDVPGSRAKQAVPGVVGASSDVCEAALPGPGGSELEELRREGHHVRLRIGSRSLHVGSRESRCPRTESEDSARPRRQRQGLLAGEPAMGYYCTECQEQEGDNPKPLGPRRVAILGERGPEEAQRGVDQGANLGGRKNGSVGETEKLARYLGKAPVFDIVNAGPEHRFTASGVLVHNCGYQGSVGALRNMGASGTDAQLKRLAYAWRDANPSIVKLWADLEAVFMRTGEVNSLLRVERARHNGRALLLPSGRPIGYRYLTSSEDGIMYVNRYGFRKNIYGGLLAENCVTGEAEVLTKKGWVRLDHVGDEAVWDGEDFVQHEGLVSKGRQHTVDVSGVRMTADHKILTEEGWRVASSTDGLNRAPASSRGHGGVLAVTPGHHEEVYDILNCGPRHRFVVRPAGGGEPMIVHNCTQAVARDLLALSLLRLEEAGYEVLLHVHDEVVIAGEHDPEEIARIMCALPEWAEGLPLAAHGGVLERYGKPD